MRRQPGTVDTNREGVGGGFRELDEEEAAEARRRREQFENDDTGMCEIALPAGARPRVRYACLSSARPSAATRALHTLPQTCKALQTTSGKCRIRENTTILKDVLLHPHTSVTLASPVFRYDDFGRLKKKFRAGADDRKAREAAALARLHGLVCASI